MMRILCHAPLNLSTFSAVFKMAPIPVYTRREKFGIVEKNIGSNQPPRSKLLRINTRPA
jgi:hypothetical protein